MGYDARLFELQFVMFKKRDPFKLWRWENDALFIRHTCYHRVFGWIILIFGLFDIFNSFLNPISIVEIAIGFWSVRRQPETEWNSMTKECVHWNRKFFRITRQSSPITEHDRLYVSIRRSSDDRSQRFFIHINGIDSAEHEVGLFYFREDAEKAAQKMDKIYHSAGFGQLLRSHSYRKFINKVYR